MFTSFILWDVTPWSPPKVDWRFGGTCRLHLQGRRIGQARNQRESRWQADLFSSLAYSLTLNMAAIFSSVTSVDFQRTTLRYIPESTYVYLFITTGVRTSNSAQNNKTKQLRGFGPRANSTDPATAACLRSYCQLLRIEVAWSAQRIPTVVNLGFLDRSR
jgi:hypothetical protein